MVFRLKKNYIFRGNNTTLNMGFVEHGPKIF